MKYNEAGSSISKLMSQWSLLTVTQIEGSFHTALKKSASPLFFTQPKEHRQRNLSWGHRCPEVRQGTERFQTKPTYSVSSLYLQVWLWQPTSSCLFLYAFRWLHYERLLCSLTSICSPQIPSSSFCYLRRLSSTAFSSPSEASLGCLSAYTSPWSRDLSLHPQRQPRDGRSKSPTNGFRLCRRFSWRCCCCRRSSAGWTCVSSLYYVYYCLCRYGSAGLCKRLRLCSAI